MFGATSPPNILVSAKNFHERFLLLLMLSICGLLLLYFPHICSLHFWHSYPTYSLRDASFHYRGYVPDAHGLLVSWDSLDAVQGVDFFSVLGSGEIIHKICDQGHCLLLTKFGKEAKQYGIKGLVLIGAHWEVLDDSIRVAAKINPDRTQLEPAPKSFWENYPINVDVGLAKKVVNLLRNAGFEDVQEDTTYDWHDDTVTPTQWMFPDGSPPATVVSLNARFNPVFHVKIGRALRELRKHGILLCGTGGTVHNMYRNNWFPFLTRLDNFQEGSKPAQWALDFEKSVSDVVANNKVCGVAFSWDFSALLAVTDAKYRGHDWQGLCCG